MKIANDPLPLITGKLISELFEQLTVSPSTATDRLFPLYRALAIPSNPLALVKAVTQGLTLVWLGLPIFVVVAVELSTLVEVRTGFLALGLAMVGIELLALGSVMVALLFVMPTGL